jgi:hypothetical protein
MSMEQRIIVACKNPQCAYMISLPYSIPLEKTEFQPPMPTEIFPLRVVCPKCEHWYAYSAVEAEWSVFPILSQREDKLCPTSWILEVACEAPQCESLTRWHIRDDEGLASTDAALRLFHAKPQVVCEVGHPLLGTTRLRAIHPNSLRPRSE